MSRFGAFRDFPTKDPIDDIWVPITKKQYDYIEILRNDMGMSLATRNRHIIDICKLKSPDAGQTFDIWSMSRTQASKVITQLIDWKESQERI